MAYMSQERKKIIHEALKPILQKYNVKGTLSVRNNMTIVLSIREGSVDFVGDLVEEMRDTSGYIDVNPYHYKNHFRGKSLKFLTEAFEVLNSGNWDKSDISTDYFNVGWYVDVRIGKFRAPYKFTLPV